MPEFTQLLNAIEAGNPQAAAKLLPLVYDELRKLAAQKLTHEKPGQTLDATGLVHEAYLRLIANDGPEPQENWANRRHFFAAAAEAMRRILVDAARGKRAAKRGGARARVPLADAAVAAELPADDLLDLDAALTALEAEDAVKAALVRLRFFAGLPEAEAAACLGLSRATASRHWTYARAWLHDRLGANP